MIERLQGVKYPIRIVVATSTAVSDNAIEAYCQIWGIACHRGSLTDLLDRHYRVGNLYKADWVVKIPSDCPLIDPKIVDKTINYAVDNSYDYVSNLHPASYPDGNDVEVMSIASLNQAWLCANRQIEREHTTPYFWENPHLFSIGNVLWESGFNYSMTHRFTIDYQEDYEFIKTVFEELYPKNPLFSLNEILALVQEKPHIFNINKHLAGINWYRNHLDELKTITPQETKQLGPTP